MSCSVCSLIGRFFNGICYVWKSFIHIKCAYANIHQCLFFFSVPSFVSITSFKKFVFFFSFPSLNSSCAIVLNHRRVIINLLHYCQCIVSTIVLPEIRAQDRTWARMLRAYAFVNSRNEKKIKQMKIVDIQNTHIDRKTHIFLLDRTIF